MGKHTAGRQVAGSIIGVMIGLMYWMLLPMSILMVTGTAVLPLLYVWSGPISAAIMAICSLLSVGAVFAGAQGAFLAPLLTVLIAFIPGAMSIALLERRVAYFTRMRALIAAQFLMLLAALSILYWMLGENLVDLFTGTAVQMTNQMPNDVLAFLLNQFAVTGGLTAEELSRVTAGTATRVGYLSVLETVFNRANVTMKLTLPASMLTSSVLSGLLSAAFPAYISARRGDEPARPHVPLSTWYVPNRVTLGVVGCLVFSYILEGAGVAGADALTVAITSLLSLVFSIQAVSGASKRLKAVGMSRGKRLLMILGVGLLIPYALWMLGMWRCLFGSKGIVTELIRKYKEKNDRKDDDI